MIGIQISSVERKKIESLHKEYTKKIIVGRLEKIIGIFEKRFYDSFKFRFRDSKNEEQKAITKDIAHIFNDVFFYGGFHVGSRIAGQDGEGYVWNRHEYVVAAK